MLRGPLAKTVGKFTATRKKELNGPRVDAQDPPCDWPVYDLLLRGGVLLRLTGDHSLANRFVSYGGSAQRRQPARVTRPSITALLF